MFHVVYSRHLHDRENGYGSFESRWTILRNVPYSQIGEYTTEKLISMASRYDIKYKAYIDTVYSPQEQESWDKDQCYHTECYVVDDEDYYKTYKDIYPDTYIPGAIDEKEDYFHNYGQMSTFMLEQDYGR